MAYGICVEVWGDRALFTRPELSVERVSYDAMTPSAARGLLESIYWHPGMRYTIDRQGEESFPISIRRTISSRGRHSSSSMFAML